MVVGSGKPGPFSTVYFPIAKDADKYKSGPRQCIENMGKERVEAIDALEPYGDGKGQTLWKLHQLNNIDKHRVLLTAFASLLGHSIRKSQSAKTEFVRNPNTVADHFARKIPSLKGSDRPPDVKAFPLKAGTDLLTVPHSELEDQVDFPFDIAFSYPRIVEGNNVLVTLHEFAHLVCHIIMEFEQANLTRDNTHTPTGNLLHILLCQRQGIFTK